MMLIFAALSLGRRPAPELERTADGMLAHLSLLFVPAGVGVVQYVGLISDQWLPVGASVVGSTVLTIVVTALAMRMLVRGELGAERAR
jgi:holin-like protein